VDEEKEVVGKENEIKSLATRNSLLDEEVSTSRELFDNKIKELNEAKEVSEGSA